jgi:hypothetical protein
MGSWTWSKAIPSRHSRNWKEENPVPNQFLFSAISHVLINQPDYLLDSVKKRGFLTGNLLF